MEHIDIDDLLRLFYAATSAVQDEKVGEAEFEYELDDADFVFRISVRKEPRQFTSNTYLNERRQPSDEESDA